MISPSLSVAWFQLLALLAVEVSLIALVVALLRRWSSSAVWSRTFCQAGIIALLVVTAGELSGSGRFVIGWAASALPRRGGEGPSIPARDIRHAVPAAAVDVPPVGRSVGFHAGEVSKASRPDGRRAARPSTPSTGFIAAARGPNVVEPASATTDPIPARTLSHDSQARSPIHPWVAAPREPEPTADTVRVLWLGLIWGIGSALVCARVCLAQCLFVLYRLRRSSIADGALLRRAEGLARALGISRRVRVIESARLTSPIAYGLIRPTVGLPPGFGGRFEEAKQDAMLAHELAHLASHDPWWCLLADAATALLWWHPAAWWLRRQLHLASEMAADEASLLVADGPRVLAECLVELGTRLTQPILLSQLRVSGFRSHLGRRVQQLVHLEGRAWTPPRRLHAALMTIFGPMALVAVVVLCTAWAAPQALTKGDSMESMRLNWKRSLAAFALLAAVNGPDATVAVAQSKEAAAPPSPAAQPAEPVGPAATPAPAETRAPALGDVAVRPAAASPDASQADKFKQRSGLAGASPAPTAPGSPVAAQDAFSRRYGLAGDAIAAVAPAASDNSSEQPGQPKRGSRLEARLKQIQLPEVAFDGLPLGEVLRVLSDESMKRDPQKSGVNFLINPNFPPVALTGSVDPATGLPLAAAGEAFDLASVMVKFNLPLRNVSMKDVLDAIVTVADHPIQYTVEDYAVVFSVKPQMVDGQPVKLAPPAMAAEPRGTSGLKPQASPPRIYATRNMQDILAQANIVNSMPEARSTPEVEAPAHKPISGEALAAIKPQTFDVDFGSGAPSKQVGAAAAGRAGDFWNTVSVGFNDHHTEWDLKFAGRAPSPIGVEMINLGGGWSLHGEMGVKSPMLDTYNYPTCNKGGNSKVILHQVPPGKYHLYLYGHGTDAPYYGDYELTVGERNYGRKQTSQKDDAKLNTKWVEGSQYVKFAGVKVGLEENVEILIRPGGDVDDGRGRPFRDAMIAGLQLIPLK